MFLNWVNRVEEWLFEPAEEAKGPRLLLNRVLRYPYALARDLAKGDLTLRAVSLVYTTLLSVVPLIALSFSVLKGLGYHRDLEPVLYQFLEPLGDRGYELTSQVMQFVERVRGGVLGSIGLLFLIYTVITTIQKLEESFNYVWRVEQPRSFARRFTEYVSMIVIGPALTVVALGLLAAFSSSTLVHALASHEPFGTMIVALGKITPYMLVIILFTLLYELVPNTRVHFRAALIGGAFAGVLWATGGALFTGFIARSNTTLAIYAGFAIIIFSLIWLHVSCLILLLGAQLSFYVQNPQYLRPGRRELHLTGSLRERLALSVSYLIACDYESPQQHWTLNKLAEHLDIPSAALAPVVNALEAKGLLVVTDAEVWLPGRDPANIELGDILDAIRNDHAGPKLNRIRSIVSAVNVARAVDAAIRESVQGTTLKDLVRQGTPQEVRKAAERSAAG
ncbi:MAG: YhjD/YihY/BrkB family envelope integrity protein [Steroidobacteraceae bacterium]